MTYSNNPEELNEDEIKQRLNEILDKLAYIPGDMNGTAHYYIFYKEDVAFLINLLRREGIEV